MSAELTALAGPWKVSFPPNWGAPPQVQFDKLISWTDSPDEGVKYFSGTAVYAKDFDARAEWFKPGARLMLDLGAAIGRQLGGTLDRAGVAGDYDLFGRINIGRFADFAI